MPRTNEKRLGDAIHDMLTARTERDHRRAAKKFKAAVLAVGRAIDRRRNECAAADHRKRRVADALEKRP
jgi:hypothetical protein